MNQSLLLTDPNGQIAPFLIALFVATGVGAASAGVTAVVDLAVTGELGPPERYAAAFGAGFAVALCPGCGIFTGAVVGAVGGAAFGFGGALVADAAEDGRVENVDQAGQAALEGALLGALTGATAGLTPVAGSASVARQAVAQQAARGAGRQAARGVRDAGRVRFEDGAAMPREGVRRDGSEIGETDTDGIRSTIDSPKSPKFCPGCSRDRSEKSPDRRTGRARFSSLPHCDKQGYGAAPLVAGLHVITPPRMAAANSTAARKTASGNTAI
jgi:hypothetical protein